VSSCPCTYTKHLELGGACRRSPQYGEANNPMQVLRPDKPDRDEEVELLSLNQKRVLAARGLGLLCHRCHGTPTDPMAPLSTSKRKQVLPAFERDTVSRGPVLVSEFGQYRLTMDDQPVDLALRTLCFQKDNHAFLWRDECISLHRNTQRATPAPGGNTLCWLI
jgi:hypothetical protein